ncbi:hypothetical protein HKX48_007995 [Thoreauomyces humboldtii]|nr:hypothetical protein HKX48_007995 [Thoreauomyces humboldtii]
MTIATPPENSEKKPVDPYEVGWMFVQEYYTFLNRSPERLHCFYKKNSACLHGHEGESTAIVFHGQHDIHGRITELGFDDCKVLVSNVDSQSSMTGGIVVQVLGEMANSGGASHKFAQTFFLAEQPSGYYVLNDIFRYLKEDIDNEYEDAEDPTGGLDLQEHVPEEYTEEEQVSVAAHVPTPEPIHRSPSPAKSIEKPRTPSPFKAESVGSPEPRHPSPEEFRASPEVPQPVKNNNIHSNFSHDGWAADLTAPETSSSTPQVNGSKAGGSWAQTKPVPQIANPRAPSPVKDVPPHHEPVAKAVRAPSPKSEPKAKSWASVLSVKAAAAAAAAAPAPQNVPAPAKAAAVSAATTAPPAQRAPSPHKGTFNKHGEAGTSGDDASAHESRDNGFREVTGKQKRGPQAPHQHATHGQQQGAGDDEREKYSIYLRGITDAIDRKALMDVFSKVGTVRHVDLIPQKNIAFVEFSTIEAALSAIGKQFTVNGLTLNAEERRKTKFYPNNNMRGGYAPRGYHDGGMRGGRGDFRGGMQNNRGRGGFNAGPQKSGPNGPKPAAAPLGNK